MWSDASRLSLAVSLVLAGCTTVGPNFKPPSPPEAAGYAMAGDAASARGVLTPEARTAGVWWAAFNSPQLDKVIREALAHSPTLAEADAALAQAQAQSQAVRGAALPQADFSAGGQRERINVQAFGFSGFSSPTINLYSVGGTASYDLDLFGGQRRRTEKAQARVETEARRADAAYLALTGNVALEALRIATLRAEIETAEAAVASDRQIIQMVQAAERAGGQPKTAISGGQAQLAQDEALLPPLRSDLAMSRHRLAMLVGKSPAEWTAPDFDLAEFTLPAAIPVSLPSSLVRQRPDILAAEADLHAATAEIGVQTANLYPDLRLSAGLTQSSIKPEDLFGYSASGWNLGGALVGPLFHGGTLKANRRAAEADARAAMARYQGTVIKAFVQVADSLQSLALGDETLEALGRAERAAQSSLNDRQAALRLGGGPLLDVVDSQRQLARARRARVQAQGDRYMDAVRLFAATAADWRDAPGPVASSR